MLHVASISRTIENSARNEGQANRIGDGAIVVIRRALVSRYEQNLPLLTNNLNDSLSGYLQENISE